VPAAATIRHADSTRSARPQVEALAAAALERFGGAKRGFLEETVEHWHWMILTNVSSSR
jgi:hypothetical protein